jgi:hypothetical protein
MLPVKKKMLGFACLLVITNWFLHVRSDAERLQSLVQKQDKEIAENILYIKELEDRERVQAQNVIIGLIEIAFIKQVPFLADFNSYVLFYFHGKG